MPGKGRTASDVLDPVDRASEAIFGTLMTLSVTGSLSVATAGREDLRTMMLTALGCNFAWGLCDAVMYLVGATTEKYHRFTLLRSVRDSTDLRAAHRMIADALPEELAGAADEDALEAVRKRLVALPVPKKTLGGSDYAAALGVLGVVVLVTFPVVMPFLFIRDVPTAMRVSNGLALAVLYAYGYMLGRYSGAKAWHFGLGISAVGVGLVAIIMLLGG
jgi:VIT1/CCC1 family predicted Fe2+/Mn2+ transporter